ncbi:MAG: SDR family oxidoreductase [Patescibacteria group bacterium]
MKKKKKILVGGGAGYIGTQLVPLLVKAGYGVEVIDLLWFGNHLPKGVKVSQRDLFDCTEADFVGFDTFIFLAGLSNDPMAEHSPSKNFIMNAALPSYLAYIAKKAGVKRFVYASSCSVYGYTEDKIFDEESPAVSNYPYGISKLQGERGVFDLQDENFSVISLRQGTVCGYSRRMRMDLIVNTMYKTAMIDGKITVNNPAIWRPIYDVRDCAQAFVMATKAPGHVNGIFNVASGNFSVGDVGEKVKKSVEKLSGKTIDLEIKNIADMRNYKVSTLKAEKVLGFKPRYSIEHIVLSLHDNKKVIGDLNQDHYYNIRVFKEIAIREETRNKRISEMDEFKY